MVQSLPSLKEVCIYVAQAVASAVTGVELSESDPNFTKLIDDLQQEFIDNYAELGMPYGEEEGDLVRYLLETMVITSEEEIINLDEQRRDDGSRSY